MIYAMITREVAITSDMIMKTHKLLWNILFSNHKFLCVLRFTPISFIAKRKKHLWRRVVFSKVPSCKPTSLLKLTLYSSSRFSQIFNIRKIYYESYDNLESFLIFQPPQLQFLVSQFLIKKSVSHLLDLRINPLTGSSNSTSKFCHFCH